MIPPTARQAAALDAIRRLTVNGVPPSYDELAAELGLSGRSQVHYTLHRLKERGLVDFEYGRTRSLRVVERVTLADLSALSASDLVALRDRVDAELAARWRP